MKYVSRFCTLLLLAALSSALIAQSTLVVGYMKVKPEMEGTYLEVEKAWKKIHQKNVEEGVSVGWQLWRKLYAGTEDEYQYATINWYKDWAHSLKPAPEGHFDEFWDGEDSEILAKTGESREMVAIDVVHSVLSAENNVPGKYIVINHFQPKSGMESKYVQLEEEIFKPIHEEAIKRGQRANWGLWTTWPLKEGQASYTAVDGYSSAEQLAGGGGDDLLEVVHPGKSWSDLYAKTNETREMLYSEVWELVDSVFPEPAE